MLDDSFCCLRSLIFWCKNIRIDFPNMDAWKLIRFCGLVVELHMHTNVYAVYACGYSFSNIHSKQQFSKKFPIILVYCLLLLSILVYNSYEYS